MLLTASLGLFRPSRPASGKRATNHERSLQELCDAAGGGTLSKTKKTCSHNGSVGSSIQLGVSWEPESRQVRHESARARTRTTLSLESLGRDQ